MDHPARKSCNYGNSSGMINERSGPPRAKNTSHLGQVAKITIYIAGHRHEYLPTIDAARARSVRGPQPADTMVG
jgi:hypothetical protein